LRCVPWLGLALAARGESGVSAAEAVPDPEIQVQKLTDECYRLGCEATDCKASEKDGMQICDKCRKACREGAERAVLRPGEPLPPWPAVDSSPGASDPGQFPETMRKWREAIERVMPVARVLYACTPKCTEGCPKVGGCPQSIQCLAKCERDTSSMFPFLPHPDEYSTPAKIQRATRVAERCAFETPTMKTAQQWLTRYEVWKAKRDTCGRDCDLEAGLPVAPAVGPEFPGCAGAIMCILECGNRNHSLTSRSAKACLAECQEEVPTTTFTFALEAMNCLTGCGGMQTESGKDRCLESKGCKSRYKRCTGKDG